MKQMVLLASLVALGAIGTSAVGQERIGNASPAAADKWVVELVSQREPIWVVCNGARVQPVFARGTRALVDLSACLRRGQDNVVAVNVDTRGGISVAGFEVRKNGAVAKTASGQDARIVCAASASAKCAERVSGGSLRKHEFVLVP